MKAKTWVLLATVLVGALALTSGISAKDKPQPDGKPQTPTAPDPSTGNRPGDLPAPAANDTTPPDSSPDAIDSDGAIDPSAPGGGHGGGGGSHTRTLGKHICSVIGGTWDRATSTCEISGAGTASTSFLIAQGSLLLIDEGASLTVTAAATIVDDGFTGQGIANHGTLDNSGTISAPSPSPSGTGYFFNYSTGTVNNTGTFDFSNQESGYVRNDGTFANSGFFQTWAFDNYGSVSNESTFAVNDVLYVADGGVVNNADSMIVQRSIFVDSGGTIVNEATGSLQSHNGSGLGSEIDGTLDNYGLVTNEVGTTVINGTVTNELGATINNFGSIDNFGTVTNDGTINEECDATFTNEAGSTYTGNAPVTDC